MFDRIQRERDVPVDRQLPDDLLGLRLDRLNARWDVGLRNRRFRYRGRLNARFFRATNPRSRLLLQIGAAGLCLDSLDRQRLAGRPGL
jgi:hypothetical protein